MFFGVHYIYCIEEIEFLSDCITPLVFYMLLHVLCFVGYECIYRGSTGFGYIC